MRSCAGDSELVVQLVVDVLVLQSAQAFERIGDSVEGLQHLGLELGLDGGERHRVLEIVLVQVAFAERAFLGLLLAVAVHRLRLEQRCAVRSGGRRRGAAARRRRRAWRPAGAAGGASTPGTAAGTALASGPA